MKRLIVAIAAALVLTSAMVLPAVAANLHPPHVGSSCPEGQIGTWHFVNVQTGGAAAGSITAIFDDTGPAVAGPTKVNNNVQHFVVEGGNVLLSASTGALPGRLVLSDFTCRDDKKK